MMRRTTTAAFLVRGGPRWWCGKIGSSSSPSSSSTSGLLKCAEAAPSRGLSRIVGGGPVVSRCFAVLTPSSDSSSVGAQGGGGGRKCGTDSVLRNSHHRPPQQRRPIHTTGTTTDDESDFRNRADAALHAIQDGLDDILEAAGIEPYELTVASGVLTLSLPPHGTWVINLQAPNRQIWWSSPLSGPKRFEYCDDDNSSSSAWYSTKDGLALGPLLVQEVRHVHPHLPEFELHV